MGLKHKDQIAFREGKRFVARLVPAKPKISETIRVDPEGTYLITGGLGALGLEVAHFLVNQGARHLLLVGRRGAEGKEETVRKLEERGAQVTVLKADVSRADDVMRVLAAANSLRGIIHAAGVTTQESIAQMGLESLESVLRPKVAGAWLLHQMTERKEKALDFFVMFSSIASVWGSKGQAHYAAANAFLDALAHYRCSLGLPALAINWGVFFKTASGWLCL